MCLERYELQQAPNKVATKISWSNFKIHHENTGNNFETQKKLVEGYLKHYHPSGHKLN